MSRRTLLRHAVAAGIPVAAAALPVDAAAKSELQPVTLTLLHTNDLHSHVWHPDQPQGLVRLATLVREIRAEMPHVLLLDAGDIIHGSPEAKTFHGQAILHAMNTLKFVAATVGNHEFDQGPGVLRQAMRQVNFPMLSANVVETKTGKPFADLKPWIVVTRGGARIGVFGLTTPTTVQIEWPRTLEGIAFTDPYVAARKAVTALRTESRVDAVIALSHLGYVDDQKLAAEVDGIDIIIGGHSHTTLAEQVWVNDVLIAQTGAYGRALGRIDLTLQPARGGEPGKIIAINGNNGHWWGTNGVPSPLAKAFPTAPLLKPTPETPEDAASLRAYKPWSDKLAPTLNETLTTALEPLPSIDATTQETALGNLFADAIRAQAKTDIAFMAGSQIAPTGLPAGPVTVRDLYSVLGSYTRQHIVVARVPGQLLATVLQTARSGDNAGRYPVHLSGMVVETKGDIRIGDKPLDKEQHYTIASGAHVIQDYFYQKPGVEILSDAVDAPTVRDAAIVYLRCHTPLRNELPNPLRWPQ
ncbi:MAG: bifunctional UDP-sugar hydrolase/5'-nucleotidase [Armatimonadota bacterium]